MKEKRLPIFHDWFTKEQITKILSEFFEITITDEILLRMVATGHLLYKKKMYLKGDSERYKKIFSPLLIGPIEARKALTLSPDLRHQLDVLKRKKVIVIENGKIFPKRDLLLSYLREKVANLENYSLRGPQDLKVEAKELIQLGVLEMFESEHYKIEDLFFDIGFSRRRKRNFSNLGKVPTLKRTYYSKIFREIYRYLSGSGLKRVYGPLLLTNEEAFDKLNIPEDHPSRRPADTLFHTSGLVFRTHMTNTCLMNLREHPKGAFSFGRVFRNEDETATHSSEFFQVDAARPGTINDLKRAVQSFLRHFGFNKVSFLPDYFPFTEPSFEISILYNGEPLEVGGCGMVTEEVQEKNGLRQSWAFGIGIDRLLMVLLNKYSLKELRK